MGIVKKIKIDDKDLMIIKLLYRDARKHLAELSDITGISITAVRNRLSKLIRHGIITGFHAELDFNKLGYGIHALTGVRIEPRFRDEIIKTLLTNKRVLSLYEVTGDFDLLVEVIARDIIDLREFLTTDMFEIPGIKKTNTMIILKRHKRYDLFT